MVEQNHFFLFLEFSSAWSRYAQMTTCCDRFHYRVKEGERETGIVLASDLLSKWDEGSGGVEGGVSRGMGVGVGGEGGGGEAFISTVFFALFVRLT